MKDDQVVKRQKTSSIILDNSQRWTEDQMLAGLLHELGHALGIKGHSDGPRDVMFPEEQDTIEESKGGENPMELDRRGPSGIVTWTRINTKLTPRDTNTLIRLYNCPGPLVLLR